MARNEACRRTDSSRKPLSQVYVLNVKNLGNGEVYFARARVVDISATGFLIRISRQDILSTPLRSTLTLDDLRGESVGCSIEMMDTYIEGTVARTHSEGKGGFVVAVDFREDAPEYWRQCLVDLLPSKEEAT